LYLLSNIKVVTPGRIRYVAIIGEMRNAYKILFENLKGRDYLGDLGVHGRIISKWTLKKYRMMMWTGFKDIRIGSIDVLFWTW
jgi:hypothetical protein